jgi:hypothetical protein
MKKLQLSIGVVSNPRTWPILNGTIEPEGIELVATVFREPHFGMETLPNMGVTGEEIYKYGPGSIAHRASGGPGQLFARQLMYGDFDVSEMSMTRLIMSIAQGDDRWVGFPVFMSRRFFHMDILVRKDSGIEKPEDLKGKQVGVGNYQSVPAVWNRGMFQHDYGVHPKDINFWRPMEPDYAPAGFLPHPRFTPPPGIKLNDIPPGKSVLSMLKSGELQAALEAPGDAGHGPGIDAPEIRQLFPDVYVRTLLPEDRVVPDQSRGGDQAAGYGEAPVGGAQSVQGFPASGRAGGQTAHGSRGLSPGVRADSSRGREGAAEAARAARRSIQQESARHVPAVHP